MSEKRKEALGNVFFAINQYRRFIKHNDSIYLINRAQSNLESSEMIQDLEDWKNEQLKSKTKP